MMYPIQVIVLVILTSLYNRFASDAVPAASTGLVLLRVVLGNLGLCVLVFVASRRAVRRLYRIGVDSSRPLLSFNKVMNLARWGSIALLACELWNGGFGPLVMHRWGLEDSVLLPKLIFLAGPVLDWFVFWIAQYAVDRAVYQKALPFRLAMALPVHDLPTLPRYLSLKARMNLWLLLVELLIVPTDSFLKNVSWARAHSAVAGTLALVVDISAFLLIPWFITRIWITVPMERGALRDRLETLAKKFRIRFLDIRIWKTDHTVQNAMILGPFAFCRYFLLSDALVEGLTDEQIEAVFAHEVGHGHHRHILWYFACLWGAILTSAAAALLLHRAFPQVTIFDSVQVGQVVLLVVYLMVVFTFISRLCEHQADWFAARYMAQTPGAAQPVMPEGMLQAVMMPDAFFDDQVGVGWQGAPTASRTAVPPHVAISSAAVASVGGSGGASPTAHSAGAGAPQTLRLQRGSAIFSGALFRIIELSHQTLSRGGAMHPSPLKRADFLQRLSVSHTAVQRFDRRMFQLRAAIVLFLLLGVGLSLYCGMQARGGGHHAPATKPHPRALTRII